MSAPAGAQEDAALTHARALLRTVPLIDGHNDLPWEIRTSKTAPMDVQAYNLNAQTVGNTDIARLRAGEVGAQFWSIYIPGEAKDSGYARMQLEEIDIARRMIAMYPKDLQFVTTADGIEQAFKAGKIGSLLGLEGGHAIENSLGPLRVYYELGARYMTLTHNVTLAWADAALDSAQHGGLTPFGREVVHEMNRLGHAGRPQPRLARCHERRAERDRVSGDLLPLRRPRADRSPAQCAGFDPAAPPEERGRRDGDLRSLLREYPTTARGRPGGIRS